MQELRWAQGRVVLSKWTMTLSGSEEEDDTEEEMMLAQAGGEKGKHNVCNERVGVNELGRNAFTFISPSQMSKFQKTRKKVAEYCEQRHGRGQHELIMFRKKPVFKERTKPEVGSDGKIDDLKLMEYKQDREWQKLETSGVEKETSQSFFLILGQAVTPLRNAIKAFPEAPKVRNERDVDSLVL